MSSRAVQSNRDWTKSIDLQHPIWEAIALLSGDETEAPFLLAVLRTAVEQDRADELISYLASELTAALKREVERGER